MSTSRKIRAIPRLMRHFVKMPFLWMKGIMRWIMRILLLIGRRPQAGFVLPTTALLLLVVTLTVGAIGYRTYTRTQETIGERQQRVIFNAATPAIDRARAKLEFMFDPLRDPRAGGVPSQRQLLGMMLNDGRQINGTPGPQRYPATGPDPYTLPGEERLDLDGNGEWDNAWKYPADTNGDGQNDATVLYSIIMTAPPNNTGTGGMRNPLQDSRRTALENRAAQLQVRNAPLSSSNQGNRACLRSNGAATNLGVINGDGWFPDPNNRTMLRKNFQVNAYVVPNAQNGTVTTLEFQQDREATQGFKWAAWFRNDIEIYPGASFRWNGAMHTEGSFIFGDTNFRSYLVSSESSCIFDESELTVARNQTPAGVETFAGQFIVGITRDNSRDGRASIDLAVDNQDQAMDQNNDSVTPTRIALNPTTTDFTLEPVILQTEDRSRSRVPGMENPQDATDTTWLTRPFSGQNEGRLRQLFQPTPYLDDLFRADNRSGPKPRVGRENRPVENVTPGGIGQPIPPSEDELVRANPTAGAANSEVGLDGYWERRARLEGLRLVVGQRLELGDPAGWGGPTDVNGNSMGGEPLGAGSEPLRPWSDTCTSATNRCNEQRQRRTLLDNLPAVQATAIYHSSPTNSTNPGGTPGDFPLACLATTVHSGTPGTLDKSATFENLAGLLQTTAAISGYTDAIAPMVISDFFRGRGTNGWEFETPTPADFASANTPMMLALRNLANFAGDPLGGAPSFQPPVERVGRGQVHPYPSMAMWGDFSVLRQILKPGSLYERFGYDGLSPADKSTLHTAACTLGMLAYNIDYLEKLDYTALQALTIPGTTLPLMGTPGPGVTVAAVPTMTDAQVIQNFSGLRGRIRLIDLMIDAPDEATARTLNERIARANPLLALPAPGTAGPGILRDLAVMTGADRDFATARDRNSNPEFYVRWLERWRDDSLVGTAGTPSRVALQNDIYLMQLIITKEQVARDRQVGFLGAYGPDTNTTAQGGDPTEAVLARGPLGECFNWFNSATTAADRDPLFRLCSYRPRYPILYSLFPAKLSLDALGNPVSPGSIEEGYGGTNTADNFQTHPDYLIAGDANDRAVRDLEDRDLRGAYIASSNQGQIYQVVRPQDVALRPRGLTPTGSTVTLGGVIRDRSSGAVTAQNWILPTGAPTASGFTPNGNARNLIKVCAQSCSYPAVTSNLAGYPQPVALTGAIGVMVPIPFKDHAFFNGREMMTVRTLDLDLDLLRSNTTNLNDNYWLPRSSIVYAFREDAVSEDNIVRPERNTWTNCNTEVNIRTVETCRMNTYTDAYRSTDPPLNQANRITPKPVDYLPDPDRRPYGFRLKQGISLVRGGAAANENNLWRGISFITPNPAYILGDFNHHRSFGTTQTPIEEFTETLADDYGNFYRRTTLNPNFAGATTDQFRPSEVVADAVTILSSNFCDGSIQDTLNTAGDNGRTIQVADGLQQRYGCGTVRTTTSFLNQNRPNANPPAPVTPEKRVRWVTTNIVDSYPRILRDQTTGTNPDIGDSPLLVNRMGMPVQWSTANTFRAYGPSTAFYRSSERRPTNDAIDTRVNAILVSGISPTRTNQAYGGLHNFPRFLEWWSGRNLFFSGAFLQLNFSSYASGPFDQDAWEQGVEPVGGTGCPEGVTSREDICYYQAPTRRWGYDPALQYGPPAPVAERFQQPNPTRSEFYSEPPADDPYIQQLSRCVARPNDCLPAAG